MIKIFKNKSFLGFIGIFIFLLSFFSFTKITLAEGLDFGYVTELNEMIICGHSSEDACNSQLKTWSDGKYSDKVCSKGVLCNNSYIPISPQVGNEITVAEKYTLLAPIGDFKDIETNDIGKYFNTFLSIAIGLAGALAVIMIIIGGIEWMGTDSVFGKTEAKKRITAAILGLLIALGSYALLNTINPDLLGRRGLNIDQVNIELETEPIVSNDTFSEGEKNNKCPEGIITVSTVNGNMVTCASIAEGVKKLISDAKEDGITLFGSSYRSIKKQEEKRAQNCGGTANIYNKKAKCNPPTAIPGDSMHQGALAIDFTCNGQSMMGSGGKKSICFKWLSDKKNQTLLKNLDSEPWHWSTTGQ